MKKILILCVFGILLFSFDITSAQTKSYNNLYKVSLNNIGEIRNGDFIKGYYIVYFNDRESSKENSFTFAILDENLKEVKTKNFKLENKVYFVDIRYDGSKLYLIQLNMNTKKLEIEIYTTNLDKTASYSKELSKRQLANFNYLVSQENNIGDVITSVENQGIIIKIVSIKMGEMGFEYIFIDKDGKELWTKTFIDKKLAYQSSTTLSILDENHLGFFKLSKNSLATNKFNSTLCILNMKDGELIKEVDLGSDEQEIVPISMDRILGKNELVVTGDYRKGKKMTAKPQGLYLARFDLDGNLLKERFLNFETDFDEFIKLDKKGRDEDNTYSYFHKALLLNNNKVYLVGEEYKKVANGLGIAAAALGSKTAGVSNFRIEDFKIYELDESFELSNIKQIEKSKSTVELLGNYSYLPTTMLAMMMKAMGAFDYQFMQMPKDNSFANIIYTDYDRADQNAKGMVVGGIKIKNDGSISNDKVSVSSNAKAFAVFRSKENYIMIAELTKIKKVKKLDLRLVKFNY